MASNIVSYGCGINCYSGSGHLIGWYGDPRHLEDYRVNVYLGDRPWYDTPEGCQTLEYFGIGLGLLCCVFLFVDNLSRKR